MSHFWFRLVFVGIVAFQLVCAEEEDDTFSVFMDDDVADYHVDSMDINTALKEVLGRKTIKKDLKDIIESHVVVDSNGVMSLAAKGQLGRSDFEAVLKMVNAMIVEVEDEIEAKHQVCKEEEIGLVHDINSLKTEIGHYNAANSELSAETLESNNALHKLSALFDVKKDEFNKDTYSTNETQRELQSEIDALQTIIDQYGSVIDEASAKCGGGGAFIQQCKDRNTLAVYMARDMQDNMTPAAGFLARKMILDHGDTILNGRAFRRIALIGGDPPKKLKRKARKALRRAKRMRNRRKKQRSRRRMKQRKAGCSMDFKPNCDHLVAALFAVQGKKDMEQQELISELEKEQDIHKQKEETINEAIGNLKSESDSNSEHLFKINAEMAANHSTILATRAERNGILKQYRYKKYRCRRNLQELKATKCGIKKVRHEMQVIVGPGKSLIQDCVLEDWGKDGKCSKPCMNEGDTVPGQQVYTKRVLTQATDGVQCSALKRKTTWSCGLGRCPINCEVGEWGPWSECTETCDGGTKTRKRPITVEPEFDGQSCPELEFSVSCSEEPCDADCELAEWGKWSPCSTSCKRGYRHRKKAVSIPARGVGTCPDLLSLQRNQYRSCFGWKSKSSTGPMALTSKECRAAKFLDRKCHNDLDIIVLFDASGEQSEALFQASKELTKKILYNFRADETIKDGKGPLVSLISYGGWHNTTEKKEDKVFVTHGEFGRADEAMDGAVDQIAHAKGANGIADAAATAQAVFESSGRKDAQKIVIAVTSSEPENPRRAQKSLKELRKGARLYMVPVGPDLNSSRKMRREMRKYASRPRWANFKTFPGILRSAKEGNTRGAWWLRFRTLRLMEDICRKIFPPENNKILEAAAAATAAVAAP